jgi:hypothetical protein|tara:strand:- start:72 stop:275 length:204 start_codon:yes stop_codon:yes gene_type:complete
MYWISKKEHSLRIAIGKKRLRDFKPEEGCEYLVRTSRKSPDFFEFVPVYVGKDGKLVRTNQDQTFWC